MRQSEQLERETEQSRAQVAETLEELRARVTPGQVVDQVVSYARDNGAADFMRNLGRQVVRNPIPVTLMGAGLAWLMVSTTRSPSDPYLEPEGDGSGTGKLTDAAARARDAADRTSGKLSAAAGNAMDKARSATSSVTGSARAAQARISEARSTLAETAAGVSQRAGRAASTVAERASAIGRGTVSTSRSLVDYCCEKPLVMAGLGIALGAAIGAALPRTETEDRLMGRESDAAKDRVRRLAEEQGEKAKAVGEHAVAETQKEAQRQGMGTASASTSTTAGATAGDGAAGKTPTPGMPG